MIYVNNCKCSSCVTVTFMWTILRSSWGCFQDPPLQNVHVRRHWPRSHRSAQHRCNSALMQWVVNLCVVIHLNGRSRDSLERQGENKTKKQNASIQGAFRFILLTDTWYCTSWYFTGVAISRYLSDCCFNQSQLSFFCILILSCAKTLRLCQYFFTGFR